jgi:ABC-type Zn uptake system ZnuABC Zn-binding protein ZnuA
MRCRRILLVVVGLTVLGAGCSTNQPTGSADGTHGSTLRVVATTTQVADFARNIGGDRVQVTSLFKPNVDAHDYEPSPADIDTIARADLVPGRPSYRERRRPGELAARHRDQLRLRRPGG